MTGRNVLSGYTCSVTATLTNLFAPQETPPEKDSGGKSAGRAGASAAPQGLGRARHPLEDPLPPHPTDPIEHLIARDLGSERTRFKS